jgi:hypothetical protein
LRVKGVRVTDTRGLRWARRHIPPNIRFTPLALIDTPMHSEWGRGFVASTRAPPKNRCDKESLPGHPSQLLYPKFVHIKHLRQRVLRLLRRSAADIFAAGRRSGATAIYAPGSIRAPVPKAVCKVCTQQLFVRRSQTARD